MDPNQKLAGVVAPVFCLRGKDDLGIGDTAAVKEFAVWAESVRLRALQFLPINEPGSDHSPYNVISSMALDPLTIATHPDDVPELSVDDFERICRNHDLASLRAGAVDYAGVKALKTELLRAAYNKFKSDGAVANDRLEAFQDFREVHVEWLDLYSTFRALMHRHGESEVTWTWPEECRAKVTAEEWIGAQSDRDEILDSKQFFEFVQWLAWSQWKDVREFCAERGISLVGDIPVGVSLYSCDVWGDPDLFDLQRSSGAPPEPTFSSDEFTKKWGQNWGFPLYDWQAMSHDNFAWWRRRLEGMRVMFDLIRVDHALGFFRIYSFPWRPEHNAEFLPLDAEEASERTGGLLPGFMPNDDESPENREVNRKHGEVLFGILKDATGPNCLIAEDLGTVAPYVRPVLESLEIPGFKIPQWEHGDNGRLTMGADYPRLSLATYATHDHPPFKTYWNSLIERLKSENTDAAAGAAFELELVCEFMDIKPGPKTLKPFSLSIHRTALAALYQSNSWLVIPMITDLLGLEDRFNFPGEVGGQNWTARLECEISGISTQFREQCKILATLAAESGRSGD